MSSMISLGLTCLNTCAVDVVVSTGAVFPLLKAWVFNCNIYNGEDSVKKFIKNYIAFIKAWCLINDIHTDYRNVVPQIGF